MVREICGMMLAALIMLPGCTDGDAASPQQDQGSPVSTRDDGTVEIFEYGALSVEVTGVEEKRLGSTFDGQETWEYDIYVVHPGATVEILNAGTFLDSETGAPLADWAFWTSDGGRIDIMDHMEPVEITEDILGIYDPESSLLVLGFCLK